jgi:hypothetical protein
MYLVWLVVWDYGAVGCRPGVGVRRSACASNGAQLAGWHGGETWDMAAFANGYDDRGAAAPASSPMTETVVATVA